MKFVYANRLNNNARKLVLDEYQLFIDICKQPNWINGNPWVPITPININTRFCSRFFGFQSTDRRVKYSVFTIKYEYQTEINLKTKSDSAWEEFKHLRNFVNRSVLYEKNAFLNYKFKTDPHNFWKLLRSSNINSFKS